MLTDSTRNGGAALNESEKQAIREQLARLLASPFFRHSQRTLNFLRIVIERTLAGDRGNIKERTLGVEIFARNADYETAADPIVRVTAAEVRKRLAQYYQEPGHQDELHIVLPSGSYIPQFQWPIGAHDTLSQSLVNVPHAETRGLISQAAEETPELPATQLDDSKSLKVVLPPTEPLSGPALHPEARNTHIRRHFTLTAAIICIAVALLSLGGSFIWKAIHPSPLDVFWGPVLNSSNPVLICVSDQIQETGMLLHDATDPSRSRWFDDTERKNSFTTVALDDVNVITMLVGVLQSKHKQFALKGEMTTNMEDLRSGPAIFIGAFDNPWTLRLTNSLRFRFANGPGMLFRRIIDSADPAKPGWAIDGSQMANIGHYTDYAIVARFDDGNTGNPEVIVAGIGRCGSLAAGQFVSDASGLAGLEHAARAAGNKKNIEAVLSTQVINGQPGLPKVEAVYFW